MQIIGIFLPFVLITAMGWLPVLFTCGLVTVAIAWYFYYARARTVRGGAIFHVFERLGLMNCPVSEDQIVVGIPATGPLSGVEAALMYKNLLQQTCSQGSTLGGSRATQSTTTASSFETGSR